MALSEYQRAYRQLPHVRERRKQQAALRHQKRRQIIEAIKLERGCIDCGYRGHPSALDFDHRPGTEKLFGIADRSSYSIESLMAEIAKCDVRCANCHRIKTFERVQRLLAPPPPRRWTRTHIPTQKKERTQVADRKNQPKCQSCGHPKSFHRHGTSCWALGCDCEQWVAPEVQPELEPAPEETLVC